MMSDELWLGHKAVWTGKRLAFPANKLRFEGFVWKVAP